MWESIKKQRKFLRMHLRILTVPCLITWFPQLPAAVSSKQTLINLLCPPAPLCSAKQKQSKDSVHKVSSELSVDLDLVQQWDEIFSKMCSRGIMCSCAILNWFSHISYGSHMKSLFLTDCCGFLTELRLLGCNVSWNSASHTGSFQPNRIEPTSFVSLKQAETFYSET